MWHTLKFGEVVLCDQLKKKLLLKTNYNYFSGNSCKMQYHITLDSIFKKVLGGPSVSVDLYFCISHSFLSTM